MSTPLTSTNRKEQVEVCAAVMGQLYQYTAGALDSVPLSDKKGRSGQIASHTKTPNNHDSAWRAAYRDNPD